MYIIDSVIHDLHQHQGHTDDDAQWSRSGFLDRFKYAGIDHRDSSKASFYINFVCQFICVTGGNSVI